MDVSFWINTLAGLVIGILGSIIFWWVFTHVLVPKIQFEEFISKVETEETKSGIKYRLAFRNVGRRGIVDVELFVRLSSKTLSPHFPDNFTFFTIPLGYNQLPKMESKKRCYRYITRLEVHKIDELTNPRFSAAISQKFEEIPEIHKELMNVGLDTKNFEENPRLLEHLMNLGTGATLQVFLFGYDEFSGARKLFGPKVYQVTDIKPHKFPKLLC